MFSKLSESELVQAGLWVVGFVGVVVLVGLGKIPSSTIEMMLFGLAGRMTMKGKSNASPGE